MAAFERGHELDPGDADSDDLGHLVMNALMAEATIGPLLAVGLPVDPVG